MDRYVVLRDLTPRGARPESVFPRIGPSATGFEPIPEPVVETENATPAQARELARDPSVIAVARVMPTRLIAPRAGPDAVPTAAGNTWGVEAVGAHRSSATGAGVVVSVLDTGIDRNHPAFAGVTLIEQDFSGDGNGDVQGHGTHCAGTVFGRDVGGTRIGVARGVSRALIGKVLGNDGSGDSDMIFKGIQWAVNEGARVISMSLGFDFPGLVKRLVGAGWPADLATSVALEAYRGNLRMFDALMAQVRARAAFDPGTVLVAAAGNESERQANPDHEIAVSIPAAAEGIVSVGALGQSANGFVVADFSNTGPILSGPGVGVLSARANTQGLVSFNGTSMATPHVAGCAALWWEEVAALRIPLTAANVVARLRASATTTGIANGVDVDDRGAGIVQAPPPRTS